MRPRSLDELLGQEHLLGEGKLLRRAIQADRISSLILYGPPGVGKTSLAHCIARSTNAAFVAVNATTSSVDELRKIIGAARLRRQTAHKKTICFIDEIHRFNKAQQDVLLPDVEDGGIILIGATVHNPSFAIVSALLSRSLVCELKRLDDGDILKLLRRAVADRERGLGKLPLRCDEGVLEFFMRSSDGDARRALSGLEIAALTTSPREDGQIRLTLDAAADSTQRKPVLYDRDEDGHYDTASAFIKSMRGSDPDAAVYWLAKMLYAGEDPRFIARRMCILAAEDIGNADPMALVVANTAHQIIEFVGMPEARIPLAQAVIYLACAPKSNASYEAIHKAYEQVTQERTQDVPKHLKTHSGDYKYAHNYKDHYVEQEYLNKAVRLYEPTGLGFEATLRKRLEKLRQTQYNK